jgi:predicted nucleotidyltransferase
MAGEPLTPVQQRAIQALVVLDRHVVVVRGYLFGSYVEGTADGDSDVDLAAFVETEEELSIRRKAQLMSAVQEEVGDDVEVHLFPASALEDAEAASFARFIQRKGQALRFKP